MKILMYGWEFPPLQSGGLGVACQGIVEGLLTHQHQVFLVLPKILPGMSTEASRLQILSAAEAEGTLSLQTVPTTLYSPYATSKQEDQRHGLLNSLSGDQAPTSLYGKNMMEEVYRYAARAALHAQKLPHEIIHIHDWLTVEAGIQAQKFSEKPLVMHVHATEVDRSGEHPNPHVFELERRGMKAAQRVIAVSQYTKDMLVKFYGVPEWKIEVVHNAVNLEVEAYQKSHRLHREDKIVLFLGRMTMQKGPDYFLKMAKRVLEYNPNVKFIMAGDGDMMQQIIRMSIELGIERHILFAGFLTGSEIARAYSEADLYVMPSVSEPFGIAPLEAIRQGTPVLISRQSGVSEVIKSALRVDFWDIEEMAEKVIASLRYPALHHVLAQHSQQELKSLTWPKQAGKIVDVYHKVMQAQEK